MQKLRELTQRLLDSTLLDNAELQIALQLFVPALALGIGEGAAGRRNMDHATFELRSIKESSQPLFLHKRTTLMICIPRKPAG